MDAATRKAIDSKLSIAKNFDKDLAPESRIWFVDKVIRGFEGVAGATDSQVTQKTTDLVMLAKTRVTAECDFAMNLKADGNKRFNAGAMKRTGTAVSRFFTAPSPTNPSLRRAARDSTCCLSRGAGSASSAACSTG